MCRVYYERRSMSREDELIDQRHQEVLSAISGVHTRLDTLNGRTRNLESKVTVLWWAYAAASAALTALWLRFTGQPQ